MRAMAQRRLEGTHPIRGHITHCARDDFVTRRNYIHETSPLQRLRIYGAVAISIHFQDEENRLVIVPSAVFFFYAYASHLNPRIHGQRSLLHELIYYEIHKR